MIEFDGTAYDTVLVVFIAACFVQLFYILFFFGRLFFFKPATAPSSFPSVSVVVCARSEAHNLVELIPLIMDQDYEQFELVVINDRSWDDTKDILEAFKIKYKNLHVIHIEEGEHQKFFGKKMGITLGIKGARFNHFLFTDADCRPASRLWLKQMASAFSQQHQLVLGFSPFEKSKGFLNKVIRYDAFHIALQYLSYARSGVPYMGIGRNMGYTRQMFFHNKGFKNHYHINSGDDDLFVNENATRTNTTIQIQPESHVITRAKKTWEAWFIQKKRHFTTSGRYRFTHKILLIMYPVSYAILLVLLVALLVVNKHILIILTLAGLRTLFHLATLAGACKWLKQNDLVWMSFLLEPLVMALNLGIVISNRIVRPHKWN
jgi:glycosyltransferase involved in cell wall biosynthesis